MLSEPNPQKFVLPARLWWLRPLQLVIIDLSDWLFVWVIINVLWVLCSVTVILFPAATASLVALAYASYRNQAPSPRQFLHGIRQWFIPATVWMLINLIGVGGLWAVSLVIDPQSVWVGVIAVLIGLVVLSQLFLWPYMMIQETPRLGLAWRNSLFTILGGLPYALFYGVIIAVIFIPSLIVIAPILLLTPVLLSLLITFGLIAWLEQQGVMQNPHREI